MSFSHRSRLRELVVRKRWLALGFATVPVVVLALAMEGFVREVIVLPLFYIVWIGQLLFESIPQFILWALLVALAAVLAARSLWSPLVIPRREGQEGNRAGHVGEWAGLLDQAKRDDLSRWRMAQRLGQVAVEVIADRERLTTRETRRRIERGSLEVPPEIRSYLQARMRTSRRRLVPLTGARGQLALPPEYVVQFLEQAISQVAGETR